MANMNTATHRTCPRCKGTGVWIHNMRTCFRCGGAGREEIATPATILRDKLACVEEVRATVARLEACAARTPHKFEQKEIARQLGTVRATLAKLEADVAALEG